MYTAYYIANHTGKLLKVLTTVRITKDCVRGARLAAVGTTAVCWVSTLTFGSTGAYIIFTDEEDDFLFAPFGTHVKLPADQLRIVKVACYLWYTLTFPSVFFSQGMSLVLVYLFYSQYKKLNNNFCRAIGEHGQFRDDLAMFRRRHNAMTITERYRRHVKCQGASIDIAA